MKPTSLIVFTAEELILLGQIILAVGQRDISEIDVKGLSFRKLALKIGEHIEKL